MRDFRDRVAVVTGGASGVGREIGRALAREGAQVVLADINAEALRAVAAEISEGAAHAAAGVRVDVTKEASVEALAEEVYRRFGATHLLFNNAGVGLGEARKFVWTLTMTDWHWGYDVNVMGVVHGIRAFVPRMLAGGEEGVVINTASANGGLYSLPNTPIYASTKAAVTSLSEVLYQQLKKESGGRLRAALLFPGPHTVNTGIMASRRVRPKDYVPTEPEAPVAYNTMQELVQATGLKLQLTEPEEVAAFALQGLKDGHFWLVPANPDGDKVLEARIAGILARGDPPAA